MWHDVVGVIAIMAELGVTDRPSYASVMRSKPTRMVSSLAAVQLADAAFNAVPNQWIKDDLDHLGFPERLRVIFPIIKSGSALGLVAGLRWPRLGRLTAMALIAYFIAALGFHARAKDGPLRYAPAAAMLAWSARTLGAYPVRA